MRLKGQMLISREKALLLLLLLLLQQLPNSTAVECEGTCDSTTCDFIDNMCLNTVDTLPGDFLLPDTPCAGNLWGLLFEIVLFVYAMLGLGIVCDDYMCVALERMCDVWMIREDVAGATFMAFGSAAPEIIINLVGTLKQARSYPPPQSALDASNMGVGAILGSGMIAFLVIPSTCALLAGSDIELKLKRRPLLRDFFFYIVLLVLLCVFLHNGTITTLESLILVLVYLGYVVVVIAAPKVRRTYRHRFLKRPIKKRKSFVNKKAKDGGFTAIAAAVVVEETDASSSSSVLSPLLDAAEKGSDDDAAPASASVSTSTVNIAVNSSVMGALFGSMVPPLGVGGMEAWEAAAMQEEQQEDAAERAGGGDTVSSALRKGSKRGSAVNFAVDSDAVRAAAEGGGVGAGTAPESPRPDFEHPNGVQLVPSDADIDTDAAVGDEDEAALPPGRFVYLLKAFAKPLVFLFDLTCPPCEEGAEWEAWYPLTFLVSFLWISFFSNVISSCVQRWTAFTPAWAQGSFFGLLTIAIGAEIPDTIQSVTMAKRGYGSMAVSNAIGSQIINISLGLGLSWLVGNLCMDDGNSVHLTDHADLMVAAYFLLIAVGVSVMTLLGMVVVKRARKAELTATKGKLMIAVYIVIVISYVCVMLSRHSGGGPC